MGKLLDRMNEAWGDPRELYGLTFSPLTMNAYQAWITFSGALTVRLSTLPARYAVKCYADALYTLLRDKGDTRYMMFKLLMGLSMGLPEEDISNCIREVGTQDGLKSVIVQYGENRAVLMPYQLDAVRKAIAEMNGVDLPDESDNAEIIQAEEDLKSLGQKNNLDINLYDEMASVAAVSGLRMNDIREMSILEYTRLKHAHNRRLMYVICAIAEGNGAKFSKGNPAPNWMFDRIDPDHGLVRLDKWQKEMGDTIKSGAPAGMAQFMPGAGS